MPDPAAFEIVNPDGRSPYVLTCEHASNFIPARYHKLGLPDAELQRHIAWDIGAATLSRRLSALLDAPLVLSTYSRLLIDCNRPLHSPTLVPLISEATEIPGNQALPPEDIKWRADTCYWPFQNAVSSLLDRRHDRKQATTILATHSFTPVFKGEKRPWHAGILFRNSAALGLRLVDRLHSPSRPVEANQPYQISDDGDFTIPVHAEARGLDGVLLEIRQDLIAGDDGAETWAHLIAEALAG